MDEKLLRVVTYADGSVYEGQTSNGLMNGYGKLVYNQIESNNNRIRYEGMFKDDMPHGNGRIMFKDGSVFEGSVFEGKKEGKGKQIWPDGEYYDGEFKNDKRCGYGIYCYPTGAIYKGYWNDNKKNGTGIYNFSDGSVYDGDWFDNLCHGKGTCTYSDGAVYDGEWVLNKRHGRGKLIYSSSNAIYTGHFEEDLRHGHGKYKSPNVLYDGIWEYDDPVGVSEDVLLMIRTESNNEMPSNSNNASSWFACCNNLSLGLGSTTIKLEFPNSLT